MKKSFFLIITIFALFQNCKNNPPSKSPDPNDDSKHFHGSHLVRVFPDLNDTVLSNLTNTCELNQCLLRNKSVQCMKCSCWVPRPYQLVSVENTHRDAWLNLKNKIVYISTALESNNIISEINTVLMDTLYYVKGNHQVGRFGCNSLICNNGELDYFIYEQNKYINLLMALHGVPRGGEPIKIDTLHNVDFKISDIDYSKLNDSIKKYKHLISGIDSSDYSYVNIFKDTTFLFTILQKP